MIEPQKAIITSLGAFILFLMIVFIIRKNKNFTFHFLILASLLPLLSLARKGVHQSGDFAINVSKAYDLWNSLSYGIFPVRWASILNATYGYPLFVFTYPLPYYSMAFLNFLGLTFIASEKILIAVVFIISGIGMYLLLKQFLNLHSSLLGAILYLFAPYHLVDMHFRTALGELFAYAFLPLIFYSILKIKERVDRKSIILLFLTYAGLILSHQAIALVTFPFVIIIPAFLQIEKRKLTSIYIALITSLLATSFYWLPVIEGVRHTHQALYSKTISFENPLLYLFSPWRWGLLYQGPTGQLSFPLGFIHMFLLLLLLFRITRKKILQKHKKLIVMLLTVFSLMIFMLFPVSEPIWKTLPFMTNFQFAYRLSLPISFLLSILGAISSSYVKNSRVLYLIIMLTMGITILNWGTRATLSDITDTYLKHHAPFTTFEGEGLQPATPIDRNIYEPWEKTPPDQPLQFSSGSGTISNLERNPIAHTYRVTIHQPSVLVENTYYFPGWTLYVNDQEHTIQHIDSKKSNKISFTLPKGKYDILLKFENTWIIDVSNAVSVVGIALIVLYVAIPQRRR